MQPKSGMGRLAALALSALASVCIHGTASATNATDAEARARELIDRGESVFAVVDEHVLSSADYHRAFAVAARERFYHSKPPEGELRAFRRGVGEMLIGRVRAVDEARRRGLQPESDPIEAALRAFDERNRDRPDWADRREALLTAWRAQLENRSLHQQFEAAIRDVPQASEDQARAYYDRRPELFTEPEKVRLSLILLRVDPSSPAAAWDAALEEGRALRDRLVQGEDFAALAREHSQDADSAARGGDMGYLHRGMVGGPLQQSVDALSAGQIQGPMRLLEGVAIVRLEDRKPPLQRGFEEVRDRAAELWQRAESERRWDETLASLRRAAQVWVNESLYDGSMLAAGDSKDGRGR
ncbi:MAG: peptidylprolyl isomerase [Burkholderiales bacterium]|nr:MAG: peptidylprolyl isomerase [Burkholderiales bacterium]